MRFVKDIKAYSLSLFPFCQEKTPSSLELLDHDGDERPFDTVWLQKAAGSSLRYSYAYRASEERPTERGKNFLALIQYGAFYGIPPLKGARERANIPQEERQQLRKSEKRMRIF